jgi:hypothetical protein
MLGAGTVINPIIKIVTTVAILAAVYFFIVAPILDTTEDSFNAFEDAFPDLDGLSTDIQGQIDEVLETGGGSASLEKCIQKTLDAGLDTDRLETRVDRCRDRFGD